MAYSDRRALKQRCTRPQADRRQYDVRFDRIAVGTTDDNAVPVPLNGTNPCAQKPVDTRSPQGV